jgi:hypothetical protein
MKKKKYYMTFYEDIALLHSVANKQTLFLSSMVARMDGDNVVQMTPYVRKAIMDEIGTKSKDKLTLARQYIKTLSSAGLIADIGDGAYMINPKLYGFSNIASSADKKQDKFIKIKYKKNKRTIEVGLLDDE